MAEQISPPLDERIDAICDAFEREWLAGARPRIDSYTSMADDQSRSRLFRELLLVDLEYRAKEGEPFDKEWYLSEFPEFAREIETVGYENTATRQELNAASGVLERTSPLRSRYVFGEHLGSGAAGDVWKAYDPRLDREVAIKVPNSRVLSREQMRRFLREGRAAAQLRHPNIVTVHEAAWDGESVYIVSDFIRGTDLRLHLEAVAINVRDAVALCARIARALHYAHEQGVIHRDLKPANILLDENYQPHITDFGLAKWANDGDEVTVSGDMLGTPAYMSPEQASGQSKHVDRRSDVFSLGVMLYEMLAGLRPFRGTSARVIDEIINAPVKGPASIKAGIPRHLDTICLKALEKAPARRYATAKDLADDLERFLNNESIAARRPTLWQRSSRLARRRPGATVALALGIVTVAMVGMKNRLRKDIHHLAGWQTVTLTSVPEGAQTLFIPIGEADGLPSKDPATWTKGMTPFAGELKAGNYLVIAALEDGRFHEVYRHVPRQPTTIPGAYNHLFWKVDEDGRVNLPVINVPPKDITHGMSLVPNASASWGDDGNGQRQGLYVDPAEVSWGEYKLRINRGRWPGHLQANPPQESDSMETDFDHATSCAEHLGKRLMVLDEFRATEAYLHRMTNWEGRNPATDKAPRPTVDLTPAVPEWTSTWVAGEFSKGQSDILDELFSAKRYRLVCGGALENGTPATAASGDVPGVFVESRGRRNGIGFRGARSATPSFDWRDRR